MRVWRYPWKSNEKFMIQIPLMVYLTTLWVLCVCNSSILGPNAGGAFVWLFHKITPLLCNVLSLVFPPFFVLLLKRTSRLHPPFHLLLYAPPEILKRLMQWAKVTTTVDIFLEQCVATVGSDSLFHSLRLSRTNVIWPLLKTFLTYEVLWIEGMSLSTEWRRNLICETAVN